jgi:hypothetical protein
MMMMDEWSMPLSLSSSSSSPSSRRMMDHVMDMNIMPMIPLMSMKIADSLANQMGPLGMLNQLSSSIIQNPLLAGQSQVVTPSSCDDVHGKSEDMHRENRIRIQNTLIKQVTYRFESSTCHCMKQQQQQHEQQKQQQQQQKQSTMLLSGSGSDDHCSLSFSRPDQQSCKLTELETRTPYANNCEALEACKAQGSLCDGVYHDGAKYYLIECRQPQQRVLTRPGLGAEYIIQLRSCF